MPAVSPPWSFRLARTTVFAVVCLALGAAAHVLAGGCLSLSRAFGGAAFAFAAALVLARRERTLGVILPVLGVVQIVLHGYFCLADAASLPEVVATLHGHGCCELVPGPGMLLAHGGAVAVTACWLARGETALWSLARRVAARLGRLVLIRFEHRFVPLSRACVTEPAVPRSAVLRHAIRLRGPPAAGVTAVS